MNATTVAVDLAKNVFELAVADEPWRIVERARLTRGQGNRGAAVAGGVRARLREAQQDRWADARALLEAARRFHVGTSAQTLTRDAGYTTATDSRVDLLTASLLLRGRSPSTRC